MTKLLAIKKKSSLSSSIRGKLLETWLRSAWRLESTLAAQKIAEVRAQKNADAGALLFHWKSYMACSRADLRK